MSKRELLESESFKNAPDDAEIIMSDSAEILEIDFDIEWNQIILQ